MADDYSAFAATAEEEALFYVVPFKHEPGRKKLIARIERAVKQATGKASMAGGSDITKLNGNGIIYCPTLNGHRIVLPGEGAQGFVTTTDKMEALGKKFKADVEAKVFDDQIEAAYSGEAKSAAKSSNAAKGNRTGLGTVAKPDDPEWMARFREVRGEPDASLSDPVPNSKGTRWIERSVYERGKAAAASRAANKKA